MRQKLFLFKSQLIGWVYRNILKKIFFRHDPEEVHDRMTEIGKKLGKYKISRAFIQLMFSFQHPMLEQKIQGIHFPNPVGLSAGFDKNAELTDILPAVGFGFIEVGSITGEPCLGNPKPRLWRVPELKSLLVYYGLKNEGAEKIFQKLRAKKFQIPVGTSIAKTNSPDTCEVEKGVADYVKAYTLLSTIGSYDTINISCPNAYGGEPFTEKNRFAFLLEALSRVRNQKPMFIKISPDLTDTQVDDILEIADTYQVNGIICSNLTKKRENKNLPEIKKGGLSGKVVDELSDRQISYIYQKTRGRFTLIASGGIFSAEDAYRKICLGASLVQLITGMIYEGPQLIGQINLGLVQLLQKEGFTNIHEAIGSKKI